MCVCVTLWDKKVERLDGREKHIERTITLIPCRYNTGREAPAVCLKSVSGSLSLCLCMSVHVCPFVFPSAVSVSASVSQPVA